LPSDSNSSAVLLLAHGSPDNAEEMPEYLCLVTGGRGLPQHVIDEITHRYTLVGFSPLTCWTMKQRDQLSAALKMPVYIGMRNWKPFIPDVVRAMAADGIQHAIAICLAPQNSRTSVGLYRRAVEGEKGTPFSLDFVESWHDHPQLIKAFVEKLNSSRDAARAEAGTSIPVIFTAHSVPQGTITDGDPYQAQAHETAELVAREAGLTPDAWTFAFQSQGMSGGPWIGPTVDEKILAFKEAGYPGIFIQPVGFLCDHVEVLYDIDIAFKQFAEKNGMRLWRAESLNGSATLTSALEDIALSRLKTAAIESKA
jgi:protoporphyrin/coproporphyrin ferrochelatase